MSEIYKKVETILERVYQGKHHIPAEIKDHENYAVINVPSGTLATTDFDNLTALVVFCHDYCVRMEIQRSGPGLVKLAFSERVRTGHPFNTHPTIEKAIENIRNNYKER